MLEIRDICKTYRPKNGQPVQALKKVSVKFAEKGLVFILGKSGCGKSTLLNCIGGLDSFDSGEIIIKGKSSKEFSGSDFDSYRNTFIGFIFQEYNILSEFNIEKNIAFALELQGKEASKEEVQRILNMVDLGDMAKRKTNELSGGQKQRVAIARALIKDPEIIVADEPTGALDSATGIQVFDTLKKLAQEKLVIVVSHDREFAEIYGDRIIEMKDGVIISDETKRKVAPHAVSDDLTFIGEDLIHIKKGHKFTADEKDKIIKFLESRDTETIISVDEKKNQKFKQVAKIDENNQTEKFTETTDEDRRSKQYNKNDLKLIKSRLKFKDSFKIGASSLKAKPVRLVFTILLSFIAFTIFGVVDTLSSFNRPKAVWDTVQQFDNKYVSLMKETPGDYSNLTMPWKQADIDYMTENYPDIKLKKIVNANINHGSSYYPNYESGNNGLRLYYNELKTETSNVFKTPFMSGMTHLTETELQTLGFTVTGRLPENEGEIAISKHLYDCFNSLNSDKITSEQVLLDNYNKCSVGGIQEVCTIVGIVDDKTDLSKYSSVTSEELKEDGNLEEKIARELLFGFSNMVYINNSQYNKFLNEGVDFGGMNVFNGEDNIGWFYEDYTTLDEIAYDELYGNSYQFYNSVYYKNNTSINQGENTFINLEEGTILLNKNGLKYALGLYSDWDLQNKINDTANPLKVKAQHYDGTNFTVIKEYTVVGYYEEENIVITSSTDIALLNTEKSSNDVVFTYGATNNIVQSTGFAVYDFKGAFEAPGTPWEVTKESLISRSNIAYIKTGYNFNQNGVYDLGLNDIIITSDMLRDFASGDELYAIIDAGLTIEMKMGYSAESKTMFTFNVVGVKSGGDAIVSSKTKETVINPEFKGFDYVIAILSNNDIQNEAFIKYCETFNEDNMKFTVQNGATGILDSFGEIIQDVASIVLWVGVGFAVFAALLLMNFIATSISYKKREIGILRALGARSSDVFGIFFNESMVIAMINFVLATIATFVTSAIISNTIITKLGLELVLLSTGIRQVILILGVSVLTAFISSILPVYKIAKKQPIDAINNR